jgi:hypothetical protein
MRLASGVALLGALGAATVATTHVATTPAALSVFLLGLAQGVIISSLVFFLFLRQSSTAPPLPPAATAAESAIIQTIASPPEEPVDVDSAVTQTSVTPRGLLKNISAKPVETIPTALALVEPRSTRATPAVTEVVYTLEEYETLKKQNKKQKKAATPSTPCAPAPPTPSAEQAEATTAAGRPSKLPTSRRKSLRTPKPSTRYAE